MKIFLTGATGLIGGEVAQRLVARGHEVTAAIHRKPDVLSNDGQPVVVAGRVAIDLEAPGLGLDEAHAQQLAEHHDLVLHCAATTRFDLDAEAYRATNVAGTAAVLELAARGNVPMLHVSTAYVCGSRSGLIREDDPLPTEDFTNGYEASKAEAEALVAAANSYHVIARPSIVVGDSKTGAIRSFDTIYAAFKLIAEGRVRHMPAKVGATLDFVPIDHVAAGLVMLAEQIEDAAGGRFHLASGNPVPIGNGQLSSVPTRSFIRRFMSIPKGSIPQRCRRSSADSMAVSRGFIAATSSARRTLTIARFTCAYRARMPTHRHRLSAAADRLLHRRRLPRGYLTWG